MPYDAILTFDHTGDHRPNERQKLMKALEEIGWEYVPTSSMILGGAKTIDPVKKALEILARAIDQPGDLSMLALQVKLLGVSRPTPGATKPANALNAIKKLPCPPL